VQPLWERAESAPESLALVFTSEGGERQTVSSAELCTAAECFAAGLWAAGVRPGDVVIVATGHSRALIDAFLGAAAIGAVPAVAPYFTGRLDRALYADRLSRMVRGAAARAAVVSDDMADSLRSVLDAEGCELAVVDGVVAAGRGVAAPLQTRRPDDALAYLQFTSGSTGAQKAVAHTERAMREYLAGKRVADALTPKDVMVSWLPLYHDLGLISGLVMPLVMHSPTVCCIRAGARRT
jgi:acyl-CoA synthetase (AMP-forming)/AMP-acid ligase II